MSQTEISFQKKMESEAVARVFCIERKYMIEESFCKYVCPQYSNCPLQVMMEYVIENLSISLNSTKGHNLNIIQEQYLREPLNTKSQVRYLQHFPQIGHKKGESWPSCDCLACCGELIINVMEKTSSSLNII